MSRRVLIVEDDESLRTALVRRIRGHGHEVRAAESAEAAAEHVEWATVIVLDLILPSVQGDDVIASWREHAGIVAISGDSSRLDRAGLADETLTKPIAPGSLRRAIDRAATAWWSRQMHEGRADSAPATRDPIDVATRRAEMAIDRVEDPTQRNALRVTLAIVMIVGVLFTMVWGAARVASADCREDALYWRHRYEELVEALLAKDDQLGNAILGDLSGVGSFFCDDEDCGRATLTSNRR